jgi:hypothetical protein
MLISEIYDEYKVMSNLQTHMYRVAAVGQLISQNMNVPLEGANIVSACLLHDIGNIIKFNLDLFPEFLEPEGLAYWQHVKKEYIEKYGTDEHLATYTIVGEIGAPKRVLELVAAVGFSKAELNMKSDDINKKICAYADMRVSPHGVCTLEERAKEGKIRYKVDQNAAWRDSHDRLVISLKEIEKQIFAECSIKPEEITDASIHPLLTQFEHFDVPGTIHPVIKP